MRSAAIACLGVGILCVAGFAAATAGFVSTEFNSIELTLDMVSTGALVLGGALLLLENPRGIWIAIGGSVLVLLSAWVPLNHDSGELDFEASLTVGLLGSTLIWLVLRAWHEISSGAVSFWSLQVARIALVAHGVILSLSLLGGFITLAWVIAFLVAHRTGRRAVSSLASERREHAA